MSSRIRRILLFVLLFPILAFAENNSDSVNILTWWGYLDSPEVIKEINSQCHVSMSHDIYYSDNEFLRRERSNKINYDIVIFSQHIYNTYKNQIPKNKVDLSAFAYKFHPAIRNEYLKKHYPPNVIYFMHSLSGFLWNPDVIDLSNESNIDAIFTKAKNNIVVLMDDPIEIWNLISENNKKNQINSSALTNDNFKHLIKTSTVYIANNYNKTYDQKNFAFAFAWSGEAIIYMKQANKKFKFLVHPKLSYISSDLIAALNDNPKTVCVAKALLSKKIQNIIKRNTFYFSSDADYKSINDPIYQATYQEALKKLHDMRWFESNLSYSEFEKITEKWNAIQLDTIGNKHD